MNVFELVKQNVTARQAAEMYGVRFDRFGNRAFCPWHNDGKHAALAFYDDRGTCYCHACHEGGDAIDITAQILNISPKEAIQKLKEDFHITVPENTRLEVKIPTHDPLQESRERVEAARAEYKAAQHAVDTYKGSIESPEYRELIRQANNAKEWLNFKTFEDAQKRALKGRHSRTTILSSRAEKREIDPFACKWNHLCDVVREADARLAEFTPETADAEFEMILSARDKANMELDIMWEETRDERIGRVHSK